MGAIDFKTNLAGVAGCFAPMGRSYGKPTGGKAAIICHGKNAATSPPWSNGRMASYNAPITTAIFKRNRKNDRRHYPP
jgi:hypothetical protein